MADPIFTNWQPDFTANWTKAPLRIRHRLNTHPLFTMEALADLIEGYPRAHYALVEMGAQGSPRRLWREGDLGWTFRSRGYRSNFARTYVAQPTRRW